MNAIQPDDKRLGQLALCLRLLTALKHRRNRAASLLTDRILRDWEVYRTKVVDRLPFALVLNENSQYIVTITSHPGEPNDSPAVIRDEYVTVSGIAAALDYILTTEAETEIEDLTTRLEQGRAAIRKALDKCDSETANYYGLLLLDRLSAGITIGGSFSAYRPWAETRREERAQLKVVLAEHGISQALMNDRGWAWPVADTPLGEIWIGHALPNIKLHREPKPNALSLSLSNAASPFLSGEAYAVLTGPLDPTSAIFGGEP